MFIETSAFACENVGTAFETLLNAISEVQQRLQASGNSYLNKKQKECLKLHDPELNDTKSGCCG